MSHNRDLSAAAAQIGFHSSNIGIGTDAPSETITLNHANGASIGLEYDGTENGTINVNSAAMYARAGSGKHLILGGNATESLRLTSGGDIGIANASPTNWGGGVPTIEIKGTANTGGNSTRSGAICFESGSGNNGYAVLWGQNGGIHIYTSATDRASTTYAAQFNSSGNLAFASGNGIDFSATGDASGMTSELLDDYEEGTWTPTIILDGGTAAGTTLAPESTSYKGRYVKIGDMVFVEAYVRYNFSSLSGTWTTTVIQGLPYTQGNQSSQQYTPVHIGYLSNFYSGFPTTNNNFPGGYVRSGQSDLVLTINNPNGAETTISNSVLSSSASGGIMFSAYYRDSASG